MSWFKKKAPEVRDLEVEVAILKEKLAEAQQDAQRNWDHYAAEARQNATITKYFSDEKDVLERRINNLIYKFGRSE